MSIQSEIERISSNVNDAKNAVAEYGVNTTNTTSDDLGTLIRAIPKANIVQTTGDSTTDVMSQKAVSNAIVDLSAVKNITLEDNVLDLVNWGHGLGMFAISSGNGEDIILNLRSMDEELRIITQEIKFYTTKIYCLIIHDQHDQYDDGGYYYQVDMVTLEDHIHYCDSVYYDGDSVEWYGSRELSLYGLSLKTKSHSIELAINEIHDELDQVAATRIVGPETATVGQTIAVETIDENGKPTSWKAIDIPSSGESTASKTVLKIWTVDDMT